MKDKEIEMVRTEIQILKICKHQNIVKLIDVFENYSQIYLGKENEF
jgi:serine/threonine protein kinase